MLDAAHRGYAYQDLLVAGALVDVLLDKTVHVRVDEKEAALGAEDIFDDLTTVDRHGYRERAQIKHRDNAELPLPLSTFTSRTRALRLDDVIKVVIADRDGPGSEATSHSYRIVLRDAAPTDPAVTRILHPAQPDPGPFVPGLPTKRYRFNAAALASAAADLGDHDFTFLRDLTVAQADVEWVCRHLVVEVEAPGATLDLTSPGRAEQVLLNRVRQDVGAGTFPNADRSPVDVAAALISVALAARTRRADPSRDELLRRCQLRWDFGAVARAHPVDTTREVPRRNAVDDIVRHVEAAAVAAQPVLLVGPPGQGKSWIAHQLRAALESAGWLVAEHYCFLADSNDDRPHRVLIERIIGSLLARLAEADPRLVTENRPRYAADESSLVETLRRASSSTRGPRRVALLVDGLDHVARVLGSTPGTDPSFMVADTLAALDLPPGVVLIVLSQPGSHLEPLESKQAITVPAPSFEAAEIEALATALGLVANPPESSDQDVLKALVKRAAGNPLYATYLCREALREPGSPSERAAAIGALPPYDETLRAYYEHLKGDLDASASVVADVIALVDFPVTRSELREIRPDAAPRVDAALERLRPVLVESATQGGIRVYHESFARYLREPYDADPPARSALFSRVADWLHDKGLHTDYRAFRFLIPTLARANRGSDVVNLIGDDFVSRAVAQALPASVAVANLATATGCAASEGNWPAVVRCVELARGAATYESDRLATILVDYADVPVAVLGVGRVADMLLDDERPTVPARAGLTLCAALDAAGGAVPWRTYLDAYDRESASDTTSYDAESERQIAEAFLRAGLRLAALRAANPDGAPTLDLHELAEWLNDNTLPASAVVSTFADTIGLPTLSSIIDRLDDASGVALEVARHLRTASDVDDLGSPRMWAVAALAHEPIDGSTPYLLDLGVPVDDVALSPAIEAREELLELARAVQQDGIEHQPAPLDAWLDACAVAARRDPIGLTTAEALITGPGWYPCWLRFTAHLARAEAAPPPQKSTTSLEALHLLEGDLNRYTGDPRACDLYGIQGRISGTICRAMRLLDDANWRAGLDCLQRVAREINVSFRGESGGPLPIELVLDVAVQGVSLTRADDTTRFVRDTINDSLAGRFYQDIGEMYLNAARLALRVGDTEAAAQEWRRACGMLAGYGWRRDITVFELLDPLKDLIAADQMRARPRVARVQPLSRRIPNHTDGKDTRHAPWSWRDAVARADPLAAAQLTVPALADCNMPSELIEDARLDLWQAHHTAADPFVAAAFRLTLKPGLDKADPQAVARQAGQLRNEADRALLRLVVSRADERPTTYSYSNGEEHIARDNEITAKINAAAGPHGVPAVLDHAAGRDAPREPDRPSYRPRREPFDVTAHLDGWILTQHRPGIAGIRDVSAEWARRRYDSTGPRWDHDRLVNAIGYRLAQLASNGGEGEAVDALHLLARGQRLDLPDTALATLAEGLDARGFRVPAAVAHTLAWTSARGHGGWLNFGGHTALDSLRRAAELDAVTALRTLADEVQRAVGSGSLGTYGISQALILAFATIPQLRAKPTDPDPIDIAFAAWDEAAQVIDARAPRTCPADDPPHLYTPTASGPATSGDVDLAFAIATFTGLASPSREQKRRTLLAIRFLLDEQPNLAAPATLAVLDKISDPASLTWLLAIIHRSPQAAVVAQTCADPLARLARDRHITVRWLARQLLVDAGIDPGELAPSSDDGWPRHAPDLELWTPDQDSSEQEEPEPPSRRLLVARDVVTKVAGRRLRRAERLLPGLADAVIDHAAAAIGDPRRRERLREQMRALRHPDHPQWPDAFLDPYQDVEETLQRLAAGGRAVRAAQGQLVTNPSAWEEQLAYLLLDDPAVALAIEATREPRPDIPPPPGRTDPVWRAIPAAINGTSAGSLRGAHATTSIVAATVMLGDASVAAPTVREGRSTGWRVVASFEHRVVTDTWRRAAPADVERCGAIELRRAGDTEAFETPPLAIGDIRDWWHPSPADWPVPVLDRSSPLIGCDRGGPGLGDAAWMLGVPACVLAPTPLLLAVLGLHSGSEPFTVDDTKGPALRLRTWRSAYLVNDYDLEAPLLSGSQILMRPDVFVRLQALASVHLTWREHLVGDVSLTADDAGEPAALS